MSVGMLSNADVWEVSEERRQKNTEEMIVPNPYIVVLVNSG